MINGIVINDAYKTELNTLDINDMLYPIVLDLDFQISELRLTLDKNSSQYKNLKNKGVMIMTYQVLKREIIRGVMSLDECLTKIDVFTRDNKLTDSQARELTEMAHIYLK